MFVLMPPLVDLTIYKPSMKNTHTHSHIYRCVCISCVEGFECSVYQEICGRRDDAYSAYGSGLAFQYTEFLQRGSYNYHKSVIYSRLLWSSWPDWSEMLLRISSEEAMQVYTMGGGQSI